MLPYLLLLPLLRAAGPVGQGRVICPLYTKTGNPFVFIAGWMVLLFIGAGLLSARWLRAVERVKRVAGAILAVGMVGVVGYLAFKFLQALVGR